MSRVHRARTGLVALCTLCFCLAGLASANGGPFVVKYPDGDPAAKGVLARLGPDLAPTRETRLRVAKEDLTITFTEDQFRRGEDGMPPLAYVSAAYTIENPTGDEVQVDFGFPILRGIYMEPFSMAPRPDVEVRLGEDRVDARVISNSAIYGIIRQSARRAIDRGLAADAELRRVCADVREAQARDREAANEALAAYLTRSLKWNERDAALLVEYASLEIGEAGPHPRDRDWGWWTRDDQLNELMQANLGPLAAIGEQKATQLFAQLAARFEPETAAGYEALFAAWGGDVRERSLDLVTGEPRPREIAVDTTDLDAFFREGWLDPTIYARVDYFDEDAGLGEAEAASCKAILKNLPVIFTFAPMNLIYYDVTFPARETSLLTVSYSQYAYRDTAEPASYQLAYVVHPASMWDDFGPINLEVAVPKGVPLRASAACERAATEDREPPATISLPQPEGEAQKAAFDIYRGTVKEKTGELFLAVDAKAWHEGVPGEQDVALQRQAGG